jgi:MoaA/NifB/PqqE/SkfB family radical SAM enzyme
LSCNYCYEYFSSQWAAIKNIKVNYNKSNAEENLLLFIDKNKETIQSVNLLGGEPLLQKQNLKLFDILPNKKYYLLTNLSTDIPNGPIAQKLITMPNVAWAVSFETINKKFEYVRHGANWKKLCSNLKYLKENNVREINAHPMYCTYSAFNLCEFYDFIDQSNYFTNIYWCVIQNIKGINVFTLSKSLKQKAIDEISKCVEKYKSKYDMSALINIKNSLLESLEKEYKKSDIEDFFDWLYKLENTQNVNKSYVFKDLWPEIYEEMSKLT